MQYVRSVTLRSEHKQVPVQAEKMWEQVVAAVNVSASKQAEENKTTQKSQDCFSREKKTAPVASHSPKASKKKRMGEGGLESRSSSSADREVKHTEEHTAAQELHKTESFHTPYLYAHHTGARDPSTASKVRGESSGTPGSQTMGRAPMSCVDVPHLCTISV